MAFKAAVTRKALSPLVSCSRHLSPNQLCQHFVQSIQVWLRCPRPSAPLHLWISLCSSTGCALHRNIQEC